MFTDLREAILILFSAPVYALVIGAEIIFSNLHNHGVYSKKGFFQNLWLMLINMGIDILMRGVCLLLLDWFFRFHFINIQNKFWYWLFLLIAEDLMFYLMHYADHYCRLFWAVHVTHHSSQEFNLSVGFRSSVFQPVYRFIYFIPLALAGFNGKDIMLMYSVTQIYGILIHTQYVDKLGFLEYFMATPSHHRVHHASNPLYLDKNMGMVFIFWDKLFGTFEAENQHEPVRYGLTENKSLNSLGSIIFHEWKSLFGDLKKSCSFREKLMYIFGPPGWSHDGSRKTSKQLREDFIAQTGYSTPADEPEENEAMILN